MWAPCSVLTFTPDGHGGASEHRSVSGANTQSCLTSGEECDDKEVGCWVRKTQVPIPSFPTCWLGDLEQVILPFRTCFLICEMGIIEVTYFTV